MRLWYRSRWLIFAVLASVAVVGLAACGGDDATATPAATNTPVPEPTDTPEPGATPTQAPTATPFETSTPRPTNPPTGLEGSVTMAVPEVLPVGGYRMQVAYDSATLPPGTTDLLFIRDPETGNELGEFIAEDFEFSEGGSVLDITIRQGVEWNVPVALRDEFPDGFPESSGGDGPGVVDAEDIAWWFNNANALINPESTDPDGGDLAAYFGENRAEVIDRWTVRLTLEEPTFTGIPLSEMGAGGAHGWHVSKDYFYAMGGDEDEAAAIDAMMPYHVGTGPYAQSSWTADEEGCVEAVADHWYYDNNRVNEFCLLQVGESSTQLAMLQSGEINLAQIDFSLVENATQDENLHYIRTQGEEAYVGASMNWPGNLWETEHAVSGEPLNPWESAAYEEDHPWVGAPEEYNDELPYTDEDNPSGVPDMEQARLVRWAINYAINSELMVEELTGGRGATLASEYMGPHYPGWEPSNTVNKEQIDSILEKYGWEDHPTYDVASPAADQEFDWDTPHDPARAQQLLELAGYPDGFEIEIKTYACELGQVCLEVADFVSSFLGQVGINASISREDYASVSGRMRQREQFNPVTKNCDVHASQEPLDWALPPVDSSLSRPGWGCGFEAPTLAKMNLMTRAEPDRNARIEYHEDTVNWMLYWQLYTGLMQVPKGVLATTNIESWEGRWDHFSNLPPGTNPAWIRMAD